MTVGWCPGCFRWVPLRRDGVLRQHAWGSVTAAVHLGSTTAKACSGSGLRPSNVLEVVR